MDLANKIQSYYFDHSAELPEDKQFHFATRMAAWQGDPRAFALLRTLRSTIAPPDTSLSLVFQEIITRPQTGSRNAHARRQPYFAKYPSLYGVHLALFRLRHLAMVYGIDARNDFFAQYPEASLQALCDDLLADDDALRVLSTFAVNTIYLANKIAFQRDILPREQLLAVGENGYNLDAIDDIQLLIYLYTHCIIGETNFYVEPLPEHTKPLYTAMLQRLESVITDSYEDINLDNKLEFLVCARICGYSSPLQERIYAECDTSISPDGMFIIDVHNKNIQQDKLTFEKSEHRNALFIMSASPYQPHSCRV